MTVTVGTITGIGGTYEAVGAGASFVDQSAIDTGDTTLCDGGFVELSAAPASARHWIIPEGTFALEDPSATNAVAITGVSHGDVLELPGTSVSNVVFGANSLTVTTNDGTYAFTNVIYGQTITATPPPTTPPPGSRRSPSGPDMFEDNVAATAARWLAIIFGATRPTGAMALPVQATASASPVISIRRYRVLTWRA